MIRIFCNLYVLIIELLIMVSFVACIYLAYNFIPAEYVNHSSFDTYRFSGGDKIMIGIVAAIIVNAVFFGPLLLLADIRRSVLGIQVQASGVNNDSKDAQKSI
jgi:uncharacterized membrane protein required for colicin V production